MCVCVYCAITLLFAELKCAEHEAISAFTDTSLKGVWLRQQIQQRDKQNASRLALITRSDTPIKFLIQLLNFQPNNISVILSASFCQQK